MVVEAQRLNQPDALFAHLQTTLRMPWHAPQAHVVRALEAPARTAPMDAHEALLSHLDRGPAYNQRYRQSLQNIEAQRQRPLSWAWMCEIQAILMGGDAPQTFRQTDAFCHEGRHRYRWFEGIERRFELKIEQDARQHTVHPIARGIRLYLDILFFHPFDDGNARAARIWLHHTLTQANHPVPDMLELMKLPMLVGDQSRYWSIVKWCAQLTHSQGHSHGR